MNKNSADDKPQRKTNDYTYSFVIPTLNEGESIGSVIDEIRKLEKPFCDSEILIVDGNSTDDTINISLAKGARVIVEPRKGYGRAYMTGFSRATGDIIITMDGDMTYPTYSVPSLVDMFHKRNIDFFSGDRLSNLKNDRRVMSTEHRIGNWVLTFFTNLLFSVKIWDSQSGMWIFKREIFPYLELTDNGMPFSEEIKIEAIRKGFNFLETPIDYHIRLGEVKLSTWGDGWKNLKFLFRKAIGGVGQRLSEV